MAQDWLGLEGRVVIVTGGASGIANHIVTTLAAAGAYPVIADLTVETGTERDGAYCIHCDVTSKENVQAMADAVVAKYGKIDALVNVAGINLPRLLVDVKGERPEYELDDDAYDKMFDINVRGMVYCAQACARQMLKQGGGVIVGMSSESGTVRLLGHQWRERQSHPLLGKRTRPVPYSRRGHCPRYHGADRTAFPRLQRSLSLYAGRQG